MPSRRSPIGISGITVEKVSLEPIPAPRETRGKLVTGLKEVRLLCNMIVLTEDGKSKLIPRGEVIPFEDVPERWRTSEYIEAPDAFREGKVQLLHDIVCCVPNFDGETTTWREKLFAAHSLVDLTTLPNRIVEGLVEGTDFVSQWNEDDRKRQEYERQHAEEIYSMEPEIPPDDISDGRDVHNRYDSL